MTLHKHFCLISYLIDEDQTLEDSPNVLDRRYLMQQMYQSPNEKVIWPKMNAKSEVVGTKTKILGGKFLGAELSTMASTETGHVQSTFKVCFAKSDIMSTFIPCH